MKSTLPLVYSFLVLSVLFTGCLSDGGADNNTDNGLDISNKVFTNTSNDCSDYVEQYYSNVKDIQRDAEFEGLVTVIQTQTECALSVNGIPNHDFNDATAHFATQVSANTRVFTISRTPEKAASPTALSQMYYDALMLNGVVVDMLSAGCYRPNDPQADADGNTPIGCSTDDNWLVDPLGTDSKFGADAYNAHTQPDGTYHYHGNPLAMFDDEPGVNGSPVIGFAADGFPIFGSYFLDPETNEVRKAISGYTLKSGERPGRDATDPGGTYDGLYIDDYEFTGNGDLDECNGMTVNGVYGYYVTDSYPWIIGCYSGTVNESFNKGQGKLKFNLQSLMHAH